MTRRMMKLTIITACTLVWLAGLPGTGAWAAIGICGDSATLIHAVQGPGSSSPLDGSTVVIEGVVTADFQASSDLNGFFVQEEDADADADPATSEGVFVFGGASTVDVAVGQVVRVEGEVGEFFGLTELTNVLDVLVCGVGSATPTPFSLPVSAESEFEKLEGMLLAIPDQALYVTENFSLERFGELVLSSNGRLYEPTQVAIPGAAANDVAGANDRNRIILDDARNSQNSPPVPYLGGSGTRRIGDRAEAFLAVMTYGFDAYRLQPVGGPEEVAFVSSNPRPLPPSVDGNFKIASFNVLNYFTTLDNNQPICGPSGTLDCRGANSTSEFTRQRAKIVSALADIDADVVGLIELENNTTASLTDLVGALNSATTPNLYTFVNTGTIGTDAIKLGLIYKTTTADEIGSPAILDSAVDARFDDTKNRPALVQTFEDKATGERFTVAINHLKSKGSACDDVGDPDVGDGQSNCNLTRTEAAEALVDYLATDPTTSDDPDFLIIGDLNAYAQEDPVAAILDAGYTDLLLRDVGNGSSYAYHTYVFQGESGALDHALASPTLAEQITGSAIWHINPDEPSFLDYNEEFKSDDALDLLQNDPFRSSDHDPVIVGLNFFADSDGDGVADSEDECPNSVMTATVVIDQCDSGAPNTIVAGCSVVDDILDIAAGAKNHGQFVSAAGKYLKQLVSEGDLSARERSAVHRCVTQADLP